MKTGIYLSYVGLGANLLHLNYCHEVDKKNGPVTIITLCKNLEEALADDPLIEKVFYLNQYHKKLIDIFNLAKVLKSFDFKKYYSVNQKFYRNNEDKILIGSIKNSSYLKKNFNFRFKIFGSSLIKKMYKSL